MFWLQIFNCCILEPTAIFGFAIICEIRFTQEPIYEIYFQSSQSLIPFWCNITFFMTAIHLEETEVKNKKETHFDSH